MKSNMKKRVLAKVYGMSTVIIVALVFLVFTIATAANGIQFLKPSNLSTILNQASFLVVLGIGQALVILTGANPTAARFSGINTDRVKIGVYVASSVLAAFAGLMYVARLNACEPGLGHDSNFDAITVALIGGFAMSGGYGNIWGVLGGALVTYTIQSGMNSLQMPSELQDLISGCLIIFAVFINQILANKRMQLENDLRDAVQKS